MIIYKPNQFLWALIHSINQLKFEKIKNTIEYGSITEYITESKILTVSNISDSISDQSGHYNCTDEELSTCCSSYYSTLKELLVISITAVDL